MAQWWWFTEKYGIGNGKCQNSEVHQKNKVSNTVKKRRREE